MTTPTHRFTRPITASLSAEALGHLEQWESKTGLSRSRLIDLAVMATATGDDTLAATLAKASAVVWEGRTPLERRALERDAARAHAAFGLQPPNPKQAKKGKAR